MSLIGILFVVVFVSLLIKAIAETVWGLMLIGHGALCHMLASILSAIAGTIRLFRKKPELKPEPESFGNSLVRGLKYINSVQ